MSRAPTSALRTRTSSSQAIPQIGRQSQSPTPAPQTSLPLPTSSPSTANRPTRHVRLPSHSRPNPSDGRHSKGRGHVVNHSSSSISSGEKPRRRSLRRVKDSTEDLHRRKEHSTTPSLSTSYTGSTFTVSSVGTNGLMYLRPSSRGHSSQSSYPPPVPQLDATNLHKVDGGLDAREHSLTHRDTLLSGSDVTATSPLLPHRALTVDTAPAWPPTAITQLCNAPSPTLGHHREPTNFDWFDIGLAQGDQPDEFQEDEDCERDDDMARFEASMSDPSSSVLRMSSATGQVVAASVSHLIAQITSPDQLDYPLLSNFFLTFRSFITSQDLLSRLFARMSWALNRLDAFGRKVRVRTFVALRHWILNYFDEDFLADYHLRFQFCSFSNALYDDLRQRKDGGGGDLTIVQELKKCWRSTCALYWDLPQPVGGYSPTAAINPGGDADSRHLAQGLRTGFGMTSPSDALIDNAHPGVHAQSAMVRSISIVPAAQLLSSSSNSLERVKLLRSSSLSSQAFSCIVPKYILQREPPSKPKGSDRLLGPQPVTHVRGAASTSVLPSLTSHKHQRSTSGTAINARPAKAAKPNHAPVEDLSRHVTGAIVRGILYHPGSPYLDEPPMEVYHEEAVAPAPQFKRTAGSIKYEHDAAPASTTNQSMRKLLGNMRRALSVKVDARRPIHALQRSRSVQGRPDPRRATKPALTRSLSADGRVHVTKQRQRIDLLAFHGAQAFEEAIERVRKEQKSQSQKPVRQDAHAPSQPEQQQFTFPPDNHIRQSAVSQGSRSIMIMDDTKPPLPISGSHGFANGDEVPWRTVNPSRSADMLNQRHSGYANAGKSEDADGAELKSAAHTQRPKSRSMIPVPMWKNRAYPDRPEVTQSTETIRTDSTGPIPAGPVSLGRALRRMPAGDLRAAGNIQDLDESQTPVSSLSAIDSHGMTNSVLATSAGDDPSNSRRSKATPSHSDGKAPSSHHHNRSFKANANPSFEAQVAKLAEIPDDADDDGGPASTFLKLQGLYKSPTKGTDSPKYSLFPNGHHSRPQTPFRIEPSREAGQHQTETTISSIRQSQNELASAPVTQTNPQSRAAAVEVRAVSPAISEMSYSSIPLLQRTSGGTAARRQMRSSSEWNKGSVPLESPDVEMPDVDATSGAQERIIVKTQPAYYSLQQLQNANNSFLMDDAQSTHSVSESSTVAEASTDTRNLGMRSFYNESLTALNDAPALVHPLRLPSTPKFATGAFPRSNAAGNNTAMSAAEPLAVPKSTPTKSKSAHELRDASRSATGPPAHLPFVLVYDCITIAQQLTLIERDAVACVEWRDLVELRWSQVVPSVRNWAQYLTSASTPSPPQPASQPLSTTIRNHAASPAFSLTSSTPSTAPFISSGVDLVVARFNLMFKWALSEIVLTHDTNERAACITQFIRIASACRAMHNWASMAQLTMALASADCARLGRTWSLVPPEDRAALADLEELIAPMHNFSTLRSEIERLAPIAATHGCIPFLGIYTHDLMYNAQKPAYVAADTNPNTSETTSGAAKGGQNAAEPLINFERHNTAATIVKSLLALMEASNRYAFSPLPDAMSRCLWVSCLGDEEIAKRSRALEH